MSEVYFVKVGDKVRRVNSDYRFEGTVRAVFSKLSGEERYVVEDDRGILFIWGPRSMERTDGARVCERCTEWWSGELVDGMCEPCLEYLRIDTPGT